MDLVLGVDGGGIKTSVRVASLNGEILAESEAGSGNYKKVGEDNTIKNLETAIYGAINKVEAFDKNSKFKHACFGLAGLDSPADEKIYRKIINKANFYKYLPEKTIICNDSKIGLYAGITKKNGIMIICGTGSNCYGINEAGKETNANGWDYILGDEGSGYEIGFKALRAVMRAYDGRGTETLLSKTILDELGLSKIYLLSNWVYEKPFSPGRIADLAKVVCRTAGMGDKISKNILAEQANEAFISISTVARKLGLEDKEFDIIFVGSVFKCEKYFKDILEKKLVEKFKKINFIPFTKKPVSGAIKLALNS